jgi:hypothetical protein
MKPGSSLPRSQGLSAGPCPDQTSAVHPHPLCIASSSRLGVIRLVSMLSLHFSWPQGNFVLRPQLRVLYSRRGCFWFLGAFVGIVWSFPLSTSLFTEFLVAWSCSNGGLGCFLLGGVSMRTALKPCPFRTAAGVRPARRQWRWVSTPRTRSITAWASGRCCMVSSYSNLRDSISVDQSFWYSEVGTLAMIRLILQL